MALVVYDRVQETTATTGTGTITLSGAVAGYQSFAVVGNGNTTFYCIVNSSAWEVGIGTYTSSGTTLARTTVLSNSNGNTSPITLSGASNVFVTYPASKSINYDASGVATIGSILGYSDTGIVASFASTVAGYNQVIIQNKSSSSSASSNFNVSNDAATATTGYAELGINSSTFSGTGSFNIAGASYLASASTDLTIGTYGAYNVHFVTNSNTTDAMTIYNSGGVSLGGYADPGIGTLYANNVYLGFTTITAAAGTTVLTNSSSGWQQVVGTTTQTIQLPNATTLYKGLAYTIANNSTGSVTIKDSASTTLDTTVTGGTSVLVLTANGTSAGTWVAYSYVPSSYDFSASTANFGNATITNAVWNGTTIASGYGGTGLTTFTAANNALYSTSSSALAAGTLPVAAGGTGATTFTSNGVLYGNSTSALGVTAAGTTGQVLIATTSGAPSWGSVPTTGAVTSLNFGTTGLTPASATTGAITVAGTLAVGNGGTGQTTASAAFNALSPITTAGDLILGTGVNTAGRLGIGGNGTVLTSNGTTASWSSTYAGTVTSVSGTSPVNVATGTTTPVVSLASGYGDTQNPYGTKTANFVLAGPTTGTAAAPTFRALVAADIPSGYSEFAAGTALLFQQTSAPTGWTKVTTYDNAALRIVSGTASSGGSVAFTTAFASQTPAGSVSTSISAISGSVATSISAISGSVGTSGATSATGTTDATTIATSQMPSHTHTQGVATVDSTTIIAPNALRLADYSGGIGPYGPPSSNATGGGGSHTHSFTSATHTHTGGSFTFSSGTASSSFTFSSGTASSSFTGTAINLAVKYVDAIICTKN